MLDQEQSILGYMAKLIALDAMALSEAVNGDDVVGTEAQTAQTDVTNAVDFFVRR